MSVAPATQTDGARAGSSVTYIVGITNHGFTDDSYTLSSTGGTYPVSFLDSTCTTPITDHAHGGRRSDRERVREGHGAGHGRHRR